VLRSSAWWVSLADGAAVVAGSSPLARGQVATDIPDGRDDVERYHPTHALWGEYRGFILEGQAPRASVDVSFGKVGRTAVGPLLPASQYL
jgi:hypothetical protein